MSLSEKVHSEPAPDLWPEIDRRLTSDPGTSHRSRHAGRVASIVVASIAITGLLAWALLGLSGLSGNQNRKVPAAELSAKIPVDQPQPIVTGEGAVWVVGGTDGIHDQLWRIDPSTNHSMALPGTQGAMEVAAGEGWAWVTICHPGQTQECSSTEVLRIDPRSGAVAATIHLSSYPFWIYAGLGSVWVSTIDGLVKIDPATDSVVASFAVKTNQVGGAGGSLWATGLGGGGFSGVAQIDPASGEITRSIRLQDPCTFLATEQAIWVGSCRGGSPPGAPADHLTSIDPSTGRILYSVTPDAWGELAFGNGSLWLSHVIDQGIVVEQLDPASGEPTGVQVSVEPGDRPWVSEGLGPSSIPVVITDGSLWLTHVDFDDVVRVPIPGSP
jgi:hypothetical protein